MTACIVGWAHTPFGKHETEDPESLIVRVTQEALADAGIGPDDVDEIVVGQFNEGFSPQGFPASPCATGGRAPALQAGDQGRERLCHRLRGLASGAEDHCGRPRPFRSRRRR